MLPEQTFRGMSHRLDFQYLEIDIEQGGHLQPGNKHHLNQWLQLIPRFNSVIQQATEKYFEERKQTLSLKFAGSILQDYLVIDVTGYTVVVQCEKKPTLGYLLRPIRKAVVEVCPHEDSLHLVDPFSIEILGYYRKYNKGNFEQGNLTWFQLFNEISEYMIELSHLTSVEADIMKFLVQGKIRHRDPVPIELVNQNNNAAVVRKDTKKKPSKKKDQSKVLKRPSKA